MAGSRFLKPHEQRYAPIEGEALAITWSLLDTKYFTLGCDDLIVATDHRPLTKIYGDKALNECTSERLFNLRRRSLMWRFRVKHVPGKSIPASDAASRYPSLTDDYDVDLSSDPSLDILAALQTRDEDDDDVAFEDIQELVVAGVRSALEEVKAVTWERVREETLVDPDLCQLSKMIA